MYLLLNVSGPNMIEMVHQNPKLFMKSKENCDNNACVQCHLTKYVPLRFPTKKITEAIKLIIGKGRPAISAISDIK